jgi:soluble lytic murein transglycosylase-like protein
MKTLVLPLVLTLGPVVQAKNLQPPELKTQIIKLSMEFHLDPELVARIIMVESRGRLTATSKTGDIGLMQVNPHNVAHYNWSPKKIKTDTAYSIRAGLIVLTALRRQYKTREPATWVCRYNIGTRTMPHACLRYLNKLAAVVVPWKFEHAPWVPTDLGRPQQRSHLRSLALVPSSVGP